MNMYVYINKNKLNLYLAWSNNDVVDSRKQVNDSVLSIIQAVGW